MVLLATGSFAPGESNLMWPNVMRHSSTTALALPNMTPGAKYYPAVATDRMAILPGRYPGTYAFCGGNGAHGGRDSDGWVIMSMNNSTVPNGTFVVGWAYRETVQASSSNIEANILLFTNAGGTNTGALSVNRTTRELIWSGGTYKPSGYTVPVDTWLYLEVKYKPHGSQGILEVRINGQTVLSITGNTTDRSDTNLSRVQLFAAQFKGDTVLMPRIQVSDIYVLDTTGTSNNDYLGDIRIDRITPMGNGSQSQFLGSDGNSVDNFALVADIEASLTRYVESNIPDARDLYQMTDLPNDLGNVVAVVPRGLASKKDAVGFGRLSHVLKTPLGEIVTPPQSLNPGAFTPMYTIHTRTPDNAAWTIADINNMEVGVQVRSG